jgi:tetratricopeptide (TPR) repeat protein
MFFNRFAVQLVLLCVLLCSVGIHAQNVEKQAPGIGGLFSGARNMVKNMFGGGGAGTVAAAPAGVAAAAVALSAADVRTRLDRVTQLVASGDVNTAIDDLLYIHERNTNDAETQALLGALLLAVQQFDLAEDFLFSACELSQWTDPAIISNLAIALREKGDLDMGLKILSKGLESASQADTTGILSVSIGDMQLASNNYSAAADWYLLACFKQPNNIDMWVKASTVSFPVSGRDAKFAENVLLRALDFNKDDADILYHLGLNMHLSDRLLEAIVFYRESYRLRPEKTATLSALATALHATGELAEALPLYQAAVAADDTNVVLLSNFALLLNGLQQPQEGIKYSGRALELDPSSADAVRAHSECLAAMPVSGEL